MTGHYEFPAASYDAWKTRSPDDDYYSDYDPRDDCWHEDIDIDGDGNLTCETCGHSRMATESEIEAYDRIDREYEDLLREERRENRPWRRAWRWLQRLFEPKRDDDIPF